MQEAVKKALPLVQEKVRIKEKYLSDNGFLKYKSIRFRYLDDRDIRIFCLCGVMIVRDRLWQLNEVIIEYGREKRMLAEKLVKKLLGGKICFIVEEPELLLRAKNLQGEFKLSDEPLYDADDIATVLRVHLPWQLQDISSLWGSLLQQPQDKTIVRQLRVKLRRLRSSLVLFKPLLPQDKADSLKQLFKGWADLLGDAREFDVAIMTCRRIRRSRTEEEPMLLEDILLRRRDSVSDRVRTFPVNEITAVIARTVIYLQHLEPADECCGMRLKPFVRQRLGRWIDRLLAMPVDYSGVDMPQLHRIRIKAKRLRYALQAVPEITVTPQLLRSLKSLQDVLGLLHDNYVNDRLINEIMEQNGANASLRYEAAMFCGWDSARRAAALAGLPDLWDRFGCCLRQWQEEYL